jgi:Xaa-Pro aminopeptidase
MLLSEKADQAQALLAETDLDCWLTFARETDIHPDPGIDLVVGAAVVRNSAFLFDRSGQRIAIAAGFDTANIRARGVFHEVLAYDEDIRPTLLSVLDRLAPGRIGLNYSLDDVTADGLTHGHWLLLQELLRDTPYLSRLTSAAPLLARLRGQKSPTEIARIRAAVGITEAIVQELTHHLRPGMSEIDIAELVHDRFRVEQVGSAWPWDSCPIVNTGPDSEPGHANPRADLVVQPGHLIHIDLGVRYEGYCSDMQRMWYVCRAGESEPPEEVRRAFGTVVRAIEAGMRALRPGAVGFEVDAAARRVIVEAGYPEFKHSLGHSLGRAVHDGGTRLGPRWPCYGQTPERRVEEGNVFTVELGVPTSAGFVGLEEDVVVTAQGCEPLSQVQRELWLIPAEAASR